MSQITADNPVPWRKKRGYRAGIIDADGILYATALEAQTMCDGEPLVLLDEEAILRRCLERIEEQVALLGDCPLVYLALSDRTSFRADILPSYKANRKGKARPVALSDLRRRLVEEEASPYTIAISPNLEADDVCGIIATTLQLDGYETCIISPDKDLLSIPGMTVTPKGVFSEITEERADYWHLYQALVGDTADNYKGCPGIGPKKAAALLEDPGYYGLTKWDAVVSAFESKGLTEDDALTQARVARILRASDWDPVNKEVIPWQPN